MPIVSIGRRLVERIDEHRTKDKNSHVYQHAVRIMPM